MACLRVVERSGVEVHALERSLRGSMVRTEWCIKCGAEQEGKVESGSGFLCKHVDGEGAWEEWRRSRFAGGDELLAAFQTGKLECLSEIQVMVVNSRRGLQRKVWGRLRVVTGLGGGRERTEEWREGEGIHSSLRATFSSLLKWEQ